MRISKVANNIVHENYPLIQELIKSKKVKSKIISLLLIEKHFTNNSKRIVEYILLYFFILLKSKKRDEITIGIGQLKFKHWMKYYPKNNPSIFSIISLTENPIENYNAIENFLDDNIFLTEERIATIYVGENRKYYFELYKSIIKEITSSNN